MEIKRRDEGKIYKVQIKSKNLLLRPEYISYYNSRNANLMDPKKVPLTRQQFEVLFNDSEWKFFDIPSKAWNLIPGLPRLEDTFAVMGSADPYNPRLRNMIRRCVAGFDQLVNETNPKQGEPEGNAYHFVVQESGRVDYPYILHGPFCTEMRINHHFVVTEIEVYDSDKKALKPSKESHMQPHLLVGQLRFARSEFVRGLEGVSEEDAIRRVMPMNCISWMVGHLANQEHRYWVILAQQNELVSGLNELVGYGKPASTPPLIEMWAVWRKVTAAADEYLATLTPAILKNFLLRDGKPVDESIGTLLMRNIYHYWYHIGEASSVRQMLGHANLPDFVGDMVLAAYKPEK